MKAPNIDAQQAIALVVAGGLAVFAADIATTLLGQKRGPTALVVQAGAGAAGLFLGIAVLGGKGLKLAA